MSIRYLTVAAVCFLASALTACPEDDPAPADTSTGADAAAETTTGDTTTTPDGGAPDGSAPDADAPAPDANVPDAAPETAVPDTAPSDTAATDSAPSDGTATTDATVDGSADASVPDAAPETSITDTAPSDGGAQDLIVPELPMASDADGGASDAGPDAVDNCGAITNVGCCNGNVLTFCELGTLVENDCGSNTCGWYADFGFYACEGGGEDPSGDNPIACPAP